jgi:uncharacterized protein with PIN domain
LLYIDDRHINIPGDRMALQIANPAIVAIAFGEPERDRFVRVIQRATKALISTVSVLSA